MMNAVPDREGRPGFVSALRFWLKLGLISFGGPAGQIAIMHRELVETRRWISERSFLHALNFCMLLPGPEAQQLATYLGWRLHGIKGGVAAGVLFILPGALVLYGLSWLYMEGGQLPWLAAIFHGLMPAVIAIVADAIRRIGRKALKSPALWLVALSSFISIFFFHVSFVLIVLAAAALGGWGHSLWPRQFPSAAGHREDVETLNGDIEVLPPVLVPVWWRQLTVAGCVLLLWWLPIFGLAIGLGWSSVPVQQGLFFSKAALVTFGGAYAVLPYIAQQAVETYGWLSHEQMMAGLALAETTPGPLILVLQFVGFIGGWQMQGEWSPLLAATIGASITTWATFLPSFLFVLAGAPFIERLGELKRISAAMTTITAAVVGVMLNLGLVFTLHAVWRDGFGVDWFVVVVAIAAYAALAVRRLGMVRVIAVCALAGWAYWLLLGT